MPVSDTLIADTFASDPTRFLQFLRLIEVNIDRLCNPKFLAGKTALRQALDSSSFEERQSLFREARASFNEAIQVADELDRAAAFVGLALCHEYLGDRRNQVAALESVTKIGIPDDPSTTATFKLMNWGAGILFFNILAPKMVQVTEAEYQLAHSRYVAALSFLQTYANRKLRSLGA